MKIALSDLAQALPSMRFKNRLLKEEIERTEDNESKEVSLCVIA